MARSRFFYYPKIMAVFDSSKTVNFPKNDVLSKILNFHGIGTALANTCENINVPGVVGLATIQFESYNCLIPKSADSQSDG